MSCERISFTNQEPSILFDTIFNIVKDETIAHDLYSYFDPNTSTDFIDVFGDYRIEGEVDGYKLDDNGEPMLFLNENNGKYYFWDKNNEKVYYPYSKTGLLQYFSTNDIKSFGKTLAVNFYKENIEFDFEDLTFINKNNQKLKEYIENFINTKANELMSDMSDMSKFARGVALSNSQPFVDEWVNEVKSFYKTLKLTYVEDSIEVEEESANDDLIRKESFLKDSKNNVNNNIKLFLSLIESDEVNDFGEKNFIPFDDIYTTLNKSLKNIVPVYKEDGQIEDPYELYLETINDLTKVKPYFEELHQYLSSNNISEIFKNQFVSAFNLHKNNFLGSEIIYDEEGNIEYVVKNLSDVSSRKATILQTWKYNFDKLKLNNKKLANDFSKLSELFTSRYADIDETRFNNYTSNLVKGFEEIGIDITPKVLDLFLNDNQFKPVDLNKRKNNYLKLIDNISRSFDSKVPFDNQSVYTKLAESKSFFEREGSDASVYTMGKTKWAFSNPSYLDLKIETWKKNPEELLKHFEATEYNKGSYYMDYYSKNPEALANLEIGIFNSVQNQSDSANAVDNNSINYTDSLVDYLHKTLAFRKGAKTYAKSALAGDKSTEYQIHFGNELSIDTQGTLKDGKVILNYKTLDVFYNYFKSEYNRMIYENARLENGEQLDPNYAVNAFVSQIFPELSDNGRFLLYDENNKPLYADLDQVKNELLPIINDLLSGKILSTYNNLVKEGLLNTKNIQASKVDKFILNSYEGNLMNLSADFLINSMISQVEYSKMFSGDIAYYKNPVDYIKRMSAPYTDGLYMRNSTEDQHFNVSIIAGVEVALPSLDNMKKILSPEIYNKYLEVNTTDAQAWITPQRWAFIMKGLGKWDKTRESIYNKFFESNPTYTKEELKLMAQPLKGVYFDIVDGKPVFLKYSQAVLVPSLIKGTPLENMYNEMIKGDTYNDQIHELITKDGIKVGYPTPEVTHNEEGGIASEFKLNKLKLTNAYWKLQQDLPTKGFKDTDIGSQIQKNIYQGLIYNKESVFDINATEITGDEMIVHLNTLFQSLSDLGTTELMNKLGIDQESYKILDEEKLYSSIIKQMESRNDIPDNFIKALQTNISPYGVPGASELFQNVFSSLVNKATVKVQTNGAGFIQMADYGLTKDETKDQGIIFTPWFETNSLQPPTQIGTSKNGKPIIEPGGIFLSGSLIAKYVPDYKSKTTAQLFGTKDKNYSNGIIDKEILTNIIGYRIPNQGLASNDALQVMGILPEEMGDTIIPYVGITTKTGSDFDIDKMYLMVPSFKALYKHASKLRNYAFKYLRGATIQDTIDNISSILDQIDDDTSTEVDVTALSKIMMSSSNKHLLNYELDNFVNLVINSDTPLTTYIKESIPDYNSISKLKYTRPAKDENDVEYDSSMQSKPVLQNKIIEAYKAILTHPDVINDVMNPIDVDYIEKDIKTLLGDQGTLDVFNAIEQLELKQQFRLGKAGLGQNINSLVDSVRGGMAELTLNEHYLGWGKENEKGETIFDEEYSKDYKDAPKVKLSESMMGLVNGFVDIAKDPYIVQGNWVTQTNAVGFMLLRSGAHPFYINAFLQQPMLKDYIAFRNNKESRIINDTNNILEKFKVEKIREQLDNKELADLIDPTTLTNVDSDNYKKKKSFILRAINKNNKDNVDTSELLNAIDDIIDYSKKNIKTISLATLRDQISNQDLSTQLSLFDQFIEWQQIAKSVTKNVNASKIDVNGKGKNLISLYTAKNIFNNVIQEGYKKGNLAGFTSKLYYKDKSTLLQSYKTNSIDLIEKVFNANPKYFLAAKAMPTFNAISEFIYGSTLENQKLGDKIQRGYYSYVMSGFAPLRMTTDERYDLLATMPDKIEEFKKTSNNLFIQELILKEGSKKGSYFVTMPNLKKPVSYRNDITDGWRELFEENEILAEELVRYAFVISGFNNNINQFHEFIPYEWFNKNRFNSYLKQLQIELIDKNFIDQFYRNNYGDNQIISKAFPSQFTSRDNRTYLVSKTPGKANYMTSLDIQFEDGSVQTRYYKLVGYDADNMGVYVRTSILGNNDNKGNRIEEYNILTDPMLSIFKKNKILSNMIDVNLINEVKNDDALYDILHDGQYNSYELDYSEMENEVEEMKGKIINIYAGTNENAELSNFATRPFIYNGGEFNSVEQAFQESKLMFTDGSDYNSSIHDKIANTKNPAQAKKLGRQYNNFNIKEWDKSSPSIMKNFIRASFEQNPAALQKLLSTGDAMLTHTQDKSKWGKLFPKLLMEVRKELSNENSSQDPFQNKC